MKCPTGILELKMSERQGVEIDYCPKCRGVWLDRGELDKIIERFTNESYNSQKRKDDTNEFEIGKYNKEHKDDEDEKQYKSRKRKSIFGNIFDF